MMSENPDNLRSDAPSLAVWLRFLNNRAAVICLGLLVLLSVLTLIGPILSQYSYDHIDTRHLLIGPDLASGHVFGTDLLGRDLFVRTLYGGRISLLVGIVATLVSLLIGVTWGSVAGFIGGKLDHVMMRVVDVLYAMPFIFFAILLMVFFGRHIVLIFCGE